MKKLFLTIFCLINITASVAASSTFSYFASGVKNVLFALGRGLKYFYLPHYGTEGSISPTQSVISSLSLDEDCESPKYLKYWAHKDLVDKDFRWNKTALRLWVQTSYEQREELPEDSPQDLERGEHLFDSDLRREELIRYPNDIKSFG